MTVASKDKFVNDLKASQIAAPEKINGWLAKLRSVNDAQQIANQLVENGNLTGWQAKYLLSGRKRLRFGNYVLVQRIKRDEVGDAFVGKHQQLDRLVNMLFLSSDLSKKLNNNQDLLRQLGAAADIDHPNVEHVHLIDQDSGRYVLVTDRIEGKSLNDPDLLTELKPNDLPSILGSAIEAISSAHQHGVSHGSLTAENLIVDNDGTLKVMGFLVSNLLLQLADDPDNKRATPDGDVQALRSIGKRLVARQINNDETNTTQQVGRLVEQLGTPELDLTDAIRLFKAFGETPSNQSSGPRTDKPNADSQPPQITGHKRETRGKLAAKPEQNGEPGKLKNAMPKVLFASAVVLGLATLYLLGTRFGQNGNSSSVADGDSSMDVGKLELPTLSPITSGIKEPFIDDSAELDTKTGDVQSKRITDSTASNLGHQQDPVADAVETEPAEVDSNHSPIKEQGDQADESELEPIPPATDKSTQQTDGSSIGSILEQFNSLSDEADSKPKGSKTEQKSASPLNAKKDEQVLVKKPSIESETDQTVLQTAAQRQFPLNVNLPPRNITDADQLAQLPADAGTAIKLELIADDNIAKSRIGFEMSGENNGKWLIRIPDSGLTGKTAIAKIELTDNQLNFNWLEDAKEIKNAEYLRNCVLKVGLANSTNYLALRKPITIAGFVLDRDQPRTRIDVPELEFLPKNPIAELHELDEETYGQTYLNDDRSNQQFSRENLLEVHFSELAEYQMVFLLLSCDLKNRSRIESSLQLRLDPRQRPKLATSKSLEAAKTFLEEYSVRVKHNHDTLKATKIDDLRRQLNVSKDHFKNEHKLAKVKELKAELELSEKRSDAFRKVQTQLESFYDRPIPVSIYCEVGGQRVVLATTLAAQ